MTATNVSDELKRTKFEREDRYIVVRRKDLGSHIGILSNFLHRCLNVRTVQCVVIEHDWPEYEPVWGMIRQRCEGATLSPPLPSTGVERRAFEEALTPSGETKAAYIGEFSFNVIDRDEEGEEVPRKVYVPWDVTKEIMSAIRRRALSALPLDGGDAAHD